MGDGNVDQKKGPSSLGKAVGIREEGKKKSRRKSLVEKNKHGYSKSVHDFDFTGLPSREGYLRKENRHGRWQKRFFVINNAYLNYYSSKNAYSRGDRSGLSASIDLRSASHICVLARNGVPGCKIAIQTVAHGSIAHQEECYFLRASSPVEAASWAATLNARKSYFLGVQTEQSECTTGGEVSEKTESFFSARGCALEKIETGGMDSDRIVTGLDSIDSANSSDTEDWWDERGCASDDEGFITGDEGSDESEDGLSSTSSKRRNETKRGSCPESAEFSAIPVARFPPPLLPPGNWKQPDVHKLNVRSRKYLQDGTKESAGEPVFRLIAVDNFITPGRVDHIANTMSNRVTQAIKRGDTLPFLFIVNFQVPGPPFYSFVMYFAATERFMSVLFDHEPNSENENESAASFPTSHETQMPIFPSGFKSLAHKFFFGEDDTFRDNRFKLIPRIVEGPFIVRKSVGSKPAIIGKKLKQRYFLHPNYMELDVDIGASLVAWKLTQLSLGFAKILQVDLAMVLQGNEEEELPEQVLGVCRAIHCDFSKAEPLSDLLEK